jgi:alpha-tubulin suppressor-like RCC1 family protein
MNRLLSAVLWLLILIPVAAHSSVNQLPQSGQTTVYSATDDGEIKAGKPWPNPRFSENGNQAVIDNLTGLVWAKDANLIKNRDPGFDADDVGGDGAVSWQHALEYIHRLNTEKYLGHNDWRLPNLNELASMVNQGEVDASTWLNTQGFVGAQPLLYWSSSTNVMNTGTAWTIAMDGGPLNYQKKTGYGCVWPVRGGETGGTVSSGVNLPRTGQADCFDSDGAPISCAGTGQDGELQMGAAWPHPRFMDNGDQTVTDNMTSLIWTRDANLITTRAPSFSLDGTTSNGAVAWQTALDYVRKLNQDSYLGFSDWRLPNRNELASVMNYVETNPFAWLNWQGIFNVRNNYWTSATVASLTGNAWNVHTTGIIVGENKSGTNGGSFVWPVRGGVISNAATSGSETGIIQTTGGKSLAKTDALMAAAAAALSVSTTTVANGYVCSAYSQTLAATGGATPYTWSRSSGTLPAGLTLSTAGVVSGTPTTAGTKSVTFKVKDAKAATSTKTLSIAVNAALTISTTTVANGYIGVVYSQTLAANGGKTPCIWSVTSGTLPAGLAISSAGAISGTPATAGSKTFTVQVADSNSVKATKSLTIVINPALTITTLSLPDPYIGTAYNQILAATGGKTAYTWSITSGTLPAGLTLSSAGIISGTPTTAGSCSFTVQVKDANTTTSTKSLSVAVYAAMSVSTASLPAGNVGTVYSQPLTVMGGKTPYTWSITSGALPVGLTLNASTGIVSGTPATGGSNTVSFQVKDSNNIAVAKSLIITIATTLSVTGVSPIPNAVNVATASVSATFNEALKSATITNGSFTVSRKVNVTQIAAGSGHTVALKSDGTVAAWGHNGSGQVNVPVGLSDVVAVTVGAGHTVALKSNGTVIAWGNNNSGQTNVPPNLSGVLAVAAGGNHTVALKSNGTVIAWGNNDCGQLTIPEGLTGVVAVSAEGDHTIALKGDGTVVAWGHNNYGQATPPAGLSGVIAVSAGWLHSVALKDDGSVIAWGYNGNGQTDVPQGLAGVISITAGGGHTAALKDDGTVVAWGYNGNGQINIPSGLSGVVAVAAGYYHTVALKSDGTVNAWGDNDYGQTTVPLEISPGIAMAAGGGYTMALKSDSTVVAWGNNEYGQTTPPTGLSGIVAVSAGDYHSVALKSDGTVVAWGDNEYGQTTLPEGLTTLVAVSAGWYHTVALKDNGEVIAWGNNDSGQASVPAGLSSVVAVAAGASHTVALKGDGTVVAWGDNDYGQSTPPAGLSGITAVAAGGYHTVALKGDGTVVAWGDNGSGQTDIPQGLSGVVALVAGDSHTVALKDDGTLVAWGADYFGQSTAPVSPYQTSLSGSVTWNPATLTATFTPEAPLPSGAVIKALLSQGVKDQGGKRLPADVNWSFTTVPLPVSVTTSTLVDGFAGVICNRSLTASGGMSPYSWSITSGSLPAGLTLNTNTGVISGTPTASVNSSFTVQVKDTNNTTATKTLTLIVKAPLGIDTAALADVYLGSTYSQTLSATGGASPYTWSITSGSLPGGLFLNAATGAITGALNNSTGSSGFTVQVKDANNSVISKPFTIATLSLPLILTNSLPEGYTGSSYNQTLLLLGGKAPYTCSISSGSLPSGLVLTNDGIISGTPATSGNSSFSVQMKDANNVVCTISLMITVYASPSITTAALHDDYIGFAYSQTLTSAGGKYPSVWSVTGGSLPAGLTLGSDGGISGTPTVTGNSSFTVQVKDANNITASKSFSVNITGFSVISGIVTDKISGAPQQGVTVTLNLTGITSRDQNDRLYTCNSGTFNTTDYASVASKDGSRFACSTPASTSQYATFKVRNPFGTGDSLSIKWSGISALLDNEYLAQSFKPVKTGALTSIVLVNSA